MTDTVPSRETSAAARRRVAAADRAREWRERQRETEAARVAELDALRAELDEVKAERDRLQGVFAKLAVADLVDEDIVRALVRMSAIRRSPGGPLAIGKPQVSVADVVSVAGYIRCGGKEAGQEAYDAARARVLERLQQFLPSPGEA